MLDSESVRSIIEHMNEDHSDAVLAYAQAFGPNETDRTADSATLTGVDEVGIDLLCGVSEKQVTVRIQYKDTGAGERLDSIDQARMLLVKMVKLAREKLAAS